MAIDFTAKYPGRFDPVSALYPQGKFKNRSAPNTEDGSYMERDWLNDWNGFFGALLKNANVTPNGSVDTATASQLYDALWTIVQKLLPKRTFTSNDFIRIPDVPGGLIIQWGTATFNTPDSVNGTSNSFITPFPNLCLLVVASDFGSATALCSSFATGGYSQNSFRCWARNPASSGAFIAATGRYIALGF
ncbi:MAG: gp53-like domain-containing protein [Plesiomonas shigelloides]